MDTPQSKNEYMSYFKEIVKQTKRETKELEQYMDNQFDRLDQLTQEVTPENIWETIPKILGIDTKLLLITELVQHDDFSMKEILRMVETDYCIYLKELCGNDLNAAMKYSLVFNIM